VEGQRGLQFQSAYASSKHAVVGLIDSLRIELKMEKAPVSVTNIYPSNIDTPLYDNVSFLLLPSQIFLVSRES
jgi:NAD(P)-dependent dehydrogenase (short-subunit alcohol dehydrogenase family)